MLPSECLFVGRSGIQDDFGPEASTDKLINRWSDEAYAGYGQFSHNAFLKCALGASPVEVRPIQAQQVEEYLNTGSNPKENRGSQA